jgi:hypothetical protein
MPMVLKWSAVRQGPAELTELEHEEWRVGNGAGNLYERFDGLGREIVQHV